MKKGKKIMKEILAKCVIHIIRNRAYTKPLCSVRIILQHNKEIIAEVLAELSKWQMVNFKII